jgi:hypothetical protein
MMMRVESTSASEVLSDETEGTCHMGSDVEGAAAETTRAIEGGGKRGDGRGGILEEGE